MRKEICLGGTILLPYILGSHLRLSLHVKRLGGEKNILTQKLGQDRREPSRLLRQCTLLVTHALLEVDKRTRRRTFPNTFAAFRTWLSRFHAFFPGTTLTIWSVLDLARFLCIVALHGIHSSCSFLDLPTVRFPYRPSSI
ncbi:hypothetical protein OG21DRAFT_21041 [Imleria badia]|nr:hypothetical protein OG21DRAFT_21041 [Imleria badia]